MQRLRVLLIEDRLDDADLVAHELAAGGYDLDLHTCDDADGMRQALTQPWAVVISDFNLPRFSALEALALLRSSGAACEDIPFIIVSGSIGEDLAVQALKAGAADFVSKDNLARLVPAVRRELREAELRRERRQALSALEDALKARDQFLSIASHELKTPLTTLQLQVEGLKRAIAGTPSPDGEVDLSDRLRPRLASMERSTHRLAELVERLLEITRISSGRFELNREPVDLAALLGDVCTELDDLARQAGSPLRVDTSGCRRPDGTTNGSHGDWDRERLRALLTNLLSNAIKYGAGQPIEVRAEVDAARARIVITDRGIGIALTDQARIFERFERAVPERHFGGLGIGLWLAQKIAEAHGGHIKVRSSTGEGSRFTVELPRRSSDEAFSAPAAAAAPAPTPA